MSDPNADAYRPPGRRSLIRAADLLAIQRASTSIIELGAELDDRLSTETRPPERLRLLRETTYRITRTANDAVLAYQRASRSLTAALARPHAEEAAASAERARLHAARAELLRVIDIASRRYPPRDG
jgi:hypothetical protein